jgi:predicted dehydrogenase
MNLTEEYRAVGKENFHAAVGNRHIRRGFLQDGIKKGIRAKRGLGSYYFGYGTVSKPVRVGVLGTGDEGSVLIGAVNPDYVEVTAIADIRPYNRYRAFHGDWYSPTAAKVRPGLMAIYDWKTEDEARSHVKVYEDYRDLLENEPDIEAVIIALPLHLHAPAAIAALRADKHVLTEKLMGHSVRECKEMARVADQTGLHLATGHQRHYNILYDNAVNLIQQGVLGDLHYIRAQWHRGNLPDNDSWKQPLPKEAKPDDSLAGQLEDDLRKWQAALDGLKSKGKPTDEDLKDIEILEKRIPQKRAQLEDAILRETAVKYGYQDKAIKDGAGNVVYDRPAIEELIRWRLWDRTGGGLMAELGSHQLDAASIFIAAMHGGEKQYPLHVVAAANRPIFPADRDVEDHVYCLFEFPAPGYDPADENGRQKKIGVAYASINGNGWGGYGETVFGTEGTLILDRETEALLYKGSAVNEKTRIVQGKPPTVPKDRPMLDTVDDGDPLSAAVGVQALDVAERGYTEQIEHWAWCIRNPAPENKPRCHPKVALGDAVIALTTNMAAREGKRVEFKKEWFDPDRDETPEDEKPDPSRYT